MNQKNIGYTLIIIGILIMGLTYYFKVRSDYYILQIIGDGGSCILDDGTCLHVDLQSPLLIIGYVLSSAVILFGLFLSFIDKGHERLIVEQQKVSQALASATKHEKEKDEFNSSSL